MKTLGWMLTLLGWFWVLVTAWVILSVVFAWIPLWSKPLLTALFGGLSFLISAGLITVGRRMRIRYQSASPN